MTERYPWTLFDANDVKVASGIETRKKKGPKLTQKKIDKLRDAINVVLETNEASDPATPYRRYWLDQSLALCDRLQHLLETKTAHTHKKS